MVSMIPLAMAGNIAMVIETDILANFIEVSCSRLFSLFSDIIFFAIGLTVLFLVHLSLTW